MQANRSLALVALPGAAAIALWGAYRHTVNELSTRWTTPPRLPGEVRTLATTWGRLSYRLVAGTGMAPPLVLVHGWGSSADSMWWRLIGQTDRTTLVVDLPGHGRSLLEAPFTFDLAAEAVNAAIADAGLARPILVGHSMGGPVSLTALRQSGEDSFAGFVGIATSAYWVRPRLQIMAAAAPYLLAPSSPITIGAQRAQRRRDSEQEATIAEAGLSRPSRRVLEESAVELKRFDAREWRGFRVAPGVWIVTLQDGVIAPDDQRASATHFGIPVVELTSDHSVVMRDPEAVAGTIERSANAWVETDPTRVRFERSSMV
jgi:pimeloyl-ACP methyl ester carboxylesterase